MLCRSFSSLKHIKNYLRSTMGEEWLNGLAFIHISDTASRITATVEKFLSKVGAGQRKNNAVLRDMFHILTDVE